MWGRSDSRALSDGVVQVREDVVRSVASTVDTLLDRLDDLRSELDSSGRRMVKSGRRQAELASDNVYELLRERPFVAVISAFGIGMILAHLLFGRR